MRFNRWGNMKRFLLVGVVLLALDVPAQLYSQAVDLLVSPGKLSKVHAALSGMNNCSKCHTSGKKTDHTKCLACHKDLASRIQTGTGYHRDKKTDCITCHPEHHGEEFKLIEFDLKTFDHKETGYALTGLHQKVTDCSRCHSGANALPRQWSRSYLLKETRCVTCHKDSHNGRLGATCDKCHNVNTPFKQGVSNFNHQLTAFPLKGAHAKVDCEKCHRDKKTKEKKWSGLAYKLCNDCHNNPHQPPFKKECTACHNETSWKVSTFDHNQTRYPLLGKHATLACEKCHPATQKSKKIPHATCRDCHRTDPHKGKYTKDCSACHEVAGFQKFRFTLEDHETTRYPLTGKHRVVICIKCHLMRDGSNRTRYKPLGMACNDCHKDIHLGQFTKKCDICHRTDGFTREFITFQHDKDSTYPLLGQHAKVTCEKCHVKKKLTFPAAYAEAVLYKPIATTCVSCHADFHQGQLGTTCETCHNVNSFKTVSGFDHEKTQYSLKGFHEKVECRLCHPRESISTANGQIVETIRFKPLGKTCMDCHRNYNHANTAFPLTGKHLTLECQQCHTSSTPHTRTTRTRKQGAFECRFCHRSPHPGNQPQCADCHTTENWHVDSWQQAV